MLGQPGKLTARLPGLAELSKRRRRELPQRHHRGCTEHLVWPCRERPRELPGRRPSDRVQPRAQPQLHVDLLHGGFRHYGVHDLRRSHRQRRALRTVATVGACGSVPPPSRPPCASPLLPRKIGAAAIGEVQAVRWSRPRGRDLMQTSLTEGHQRPDVFAGPVRLRSVLAGPLANLTRAIGKGANAEHLALSAAYHGVDSGSSSDITRSNFSMPASAAPRLGCSLDEREPDLRASAHWSGGVRATSRLALRSCLGRRHPSQLTCATGPCVGHLAARTPAATEPARKGRVGRCGGRPPQK
jgi:hypothetical protein